MTDDNDTQDEIALAAEYALGLLTPGEAMAFDDLLAVDPEMRDHYVAWATNFASLTDDIAPRGSACASARADRGKAFWFC